MSDLYPTPTRLALLRDVQTGLVWFGADGESYRGSSTPKRQAPKVTAAVQEMARAGWIVRRSITSSVYDLTDAGRAVLDGAS